MSKEYFTLKTFRPGNKYAPKVSSGIFPSVDSATKCALLDLRHPSAVYAWILDDSGRVVCDFFPTVKDNFQWVMVRNQNRVGYREVLTTAPDSDRL